MSLISLKALRSNSVFRRVIASLCVVGLGVSALLAADDDAALKAKEAAQAAQAADATAKKAAAAAGEKEAEFDPFTIPAKADKAALIAYLNELQQWQPKVDPAARRDPDAQKKLRAEFLRSRLNMIQVTDKLLRDKLEETERVEVTKTKWSAHRYQAMLDDENKAALEAYEKMTAELAKDADPELAKLGTRTMLMIRIDRLAEEKSQETPRQLVTELQSQFKTADGQPNLEILNVTGQLGYILEMLGDYPLATEVYASILKEIGASDNPQLARLIESQQTALKRLGLIGKPVALAGKMADGHDFDFSQYKGKVVLVDFWATWCGPCIAELPNVVENYQKYHSKGFEIVGISLDDEVEKLTAFVKEKKLPWTQLFSPDESLRGFEDPLVKQFGVSGIPATFLVDKNGNIAAVTVRGKRLGKLLAEMLGEVK